MKTLLLILSAFLLFGCSESKKDETSADVAEIKWLGDYAYQPVLCDADHKNNGYHNTTLKKSYLCDGQTWHVIAEDGQDGDTTNTVVTVSNPSGKAEKGPFRKESEIYIYPYNSQWKQDGAAVKGYTEANDGSYQVHADLTAAFGRYEVCGESYNEVDNIYDNVCLRLMTALDSPEKNLNPLTSVQDMIAFKYFYDPAHQYYQDGDNFLSLARTQVLEYIWMVDTGAEFSEMSLQGNTLADAEMAMFSFYIAQDRSGPEQNEHMREVADGIIDNDQTLRQQIQDAFTAMPINKIRNNLINKFAELGVSATAPPIELLPGVPSYYNDIWNNEHEVVESTNLDQSSSCTIDVSEFNSFAYPKVFANIEDARYYASELIGNISLWSASICDNGITTFSCPGTKLLDIEELREVILPAPANLNYNGALGEHSLISGQYFIVQNTLTNSAPGHICTGEMVPFGRNLATHDNDWSNAIGYNNNASPWFYRQPKSATMD